MKKALGVAAILIVIAYAAYSGYRDGSEHRTTEQQRQE